MVHPDPVERRQERCEPDNSSTEIHRNPGNCSKAQTCSTSSRGQVPASLELQLSGGPTITAVCDPTEHMVTSPQTRAGLGFLTTSSHCICIWSVGLFRNMLSCWGCHFSCVQLFATL